MPSRPDPNLNALLNQGIAACRVGDLPGARQALIAALKIDPQNQLGWLWLSSALTDPDERRTCLKRVLALNPDHAAARDGLKWLDQEYPPGGPPLSAEPAPPAAAAPTAPPQAVRPAEEAAAQAPEVSETSEVAAPGLAETPAPAWSQAAAETIAETPKPAAEPEEAASQPSWLDAALRRAEASAPLPGRPAEPAAPGEPPAEAEVEPAGPNWLAGSLQPAEAAEPAAEATGAGGDEEAPPEWLETALQRRKKTEPFSQQAIEAAGVAAEEEEVPAWLAEVNQPAGQSTPALSAEPGETIEAEDEVPSWLAEVNQPVGPMASSHRAPAFAAPFTEEAEEGEAETVAEVVLPPAARQRARLEMTACPWCGQPVPGMDLICPSCNRQLEFECPNCAYSISLDDTHCPNCDWAAGDFQQREAYLKNLGEAYLAKDAAQKALPVYRYLAELMPDSAQVHAQVSQIYYKLGRTEQSVLAAERVLELEPGNAEALGRLGHWYALHADFEKVAEIVGKLNGMPQRPPRLTLLLGDLEFERRQYPAAFRAYRAALAHPDFDRPTLARLNYRLGEMYLVAEDSLSALRAFQASVATGAEIHEVGQARARIDQIRPPLPPSASRSASETLRAMAGLVLLVWLTGLIQMGLRAQNLNAALVVALFAAVPGSYLIASAVSTPTAMEWRSILGEKGLTPPLVGAVTALLGAAIVATSIVLILFGS